MEKVINHLFEIEKKANQIIERANAEKTELFEANEKAIVKMESDIADEINSKIKMMNDLAEKEIDQEKQQLLDKSNKQLNDIEINYRQNHDTLVEKVFKAIIQL